jgi:hypothetical protein
MGMMRTPFGIELAAHLQRKRITQAELAKHSGATTGCISEVINKGRKAPDKYLSKWCSMLQLQGKEEDRFRLLAELTGTISAPTQARIVTLIDGRQGLLETVDELRGQLQGLLKLRSDYQKLSVEANRTLAELEALQRAVQRKFD